jgi:hypothetical protein
MRVLRLACGLGDAPQLAGQVALLEGVDLVQCPAVGEGVDQVMAQSYSRSQLAEAAAWEPVSRSADFDQDYPVDLVDHA